MVQKNRRVRPQQIATVPLGGILTVEEVMRIHDRLSLDFQDTDDPIFPVGVRSPALLESAVGRQETGWGGELKYPMAITNAATLTFGICNDHPFHNGNKRTALVAMLAHLDRNRLTLYNTRQGELFELMLLVAQKQLSRRGVDPRSRRASVRPTPEDEVDALADWLSRRTKPVVRGEREVTHRQLRHILGRFGYTLENPKNGFIGIYREVETRTGLLKRTRKQEKKRIGNISFPGDARIVGTNKIKQIRRTCRLTEEDGVDSTSFYEGADVIDVFINEYRTVLRRLARR
jgi:death-on-curing protein